MVLWHISRISYCFGVIWNFILAGNCPLRPILGVFLGLNTPNFRITHFSSPKRYSLHQTASFEILCAKIGSRVWAVALLKNIKQKLKTKKQVTVPVYIAPTWRLDRSSDRTNFVRASTLSNVITHAECQIDEYNIVPLTKGWSFMFQHTTSDAIYTAKPCWAARDVSR